MKKCNVAISFLLSLFASHFTFGQETQRSFPQLMQTYYLYKDEGLIDKAIDFSNNSSVSYERMDPLFTGFFGALFTSDKALKKECERKLSKFTNPRYKQLFVFLSSTDIDSIYARTPLSPAYNDMNWSSYFATGNTRYLDNIIENIPLAQNREDRNLFLTGASAMWSLSSNARQDQGVKEYLEIVKASNEIITEILTREPGQFRKEMIDVIKSQRAKGLWNEN